MRTRIYGYAVLTRGLLTRKHYANLQHPVNPDRGVASVSLLLLIVSLVRSILLKSALLLYPILTEASLSIEKRAWGRGIRCIAGRQFHILGLSMLSGIISFCG